MKTPQPQSLFASQDKVLSTLDEMFRAAPWEDPKFYAMWCAQTYYFVSNSTRLLAAGAARLPVSRDVQHIRFINHCQEEKHHEVLIQRDLEALGFSVEDIPELPMTAQLYQSQFYLIEHHDPVALFGNIFYMEGMSLSSGPGVYERTRKAFGDKATTFLKVHVSNDIGHMEKAKAVLRTLTEPQLDLVERSLWQTVAIYESMVAEMLKQYRNIEKRKAA